MEAASSLWRDCSFRRRSKKQSRRHAAGRWSSLRRWIEGCLMAEWQRGKTNCYSAPGLASLQTIWCPWRWWDEDQGENGKPFWSLKQCNVWDACEYCQSTFVAFGATQQLTANCCFFFFFTCFFRDRVAMLQQGSRILQELLLAGDPAQVACSSNDEVLKHDETCWNFQYQQSHGIAMTSAVLQPHF